MSQSRKALDAILNEGISVRDACERFGVSRAAVCKERLHPSEKSILKKQVDVLNGQCVFKDRTIDRLNGEIKTLRRERDELLAALEYHQAQTRPIQATMDVIASLKESK